MHAFPANIKINENVISSFKLAKIAMKIKIPALIKVMTCDLKTAVIQIFRSCFLPFPSKLQQINADEQGRELNRTGQCVVQEKITYKH